tara:strand:- start:605 stop:1603 length:999 start_codon:yes stop_codon:yes gene_type:complete
MFENFVKLVTENGGVIKPLLIDPSITNGLGLMNPSVYIDNGKILVNIRSVNYTLYNCDTSDYEHCWGPLVYIHPEDHLVLATQNFLCELEDSLDIKWFNWVDTSKFDTPHLWDFHGLEDARLVRWDDKLYMTGVRRDCNTIGCGRMEMSEIEISEDNYVREISRTRIPVVGEPGDITSYCEKNWMPILDKPYHYVKWGNPTEVIKYDIETDRTTQVAHTKRTPLPHDLRGGSQVIPYKDGYLGLHHITYLYKVAAGRRDGKYRHQFTYWDKDWNPIKRSPIFSFLSGKVEFTCGLAEYGDDFLITFGFMDNAAYILKSPKQVLEEFLDESHV